MRIPYPVILAGVGTIVAYAPVRLSKVLYVTMVLAHTWGIVSWLRLAGVSYFLWPLVYATIAVITVVAVEQVAPHEPSPRVSVSDTRD